MSESLFANVRILCSIVCYGLIWFVCLWMREVFIDVCYYGWERTIHMDGSYRDNLCKEV